MKMLDPSETHAPTDAAATGGDKRLFARHLTRSARTRTGGDRPPAPVSPKRPRPGGPGYSTEL
jgi:hypothetical protein